MTLSEAFIQLITKIVKEYRKNGFTIANHLKIDNYHIENITLDVEECREILDFLKISEKNVLRYLGGKYTYKRENKMIIFKQDLKCLDTYFEEGQMLFIKSSEPHKLLTDVLYLNTITPIENLHININEIKFSGLMVIQFYLYLRSKNLFDEKIDYFIHSNEYIQRNKLMRITKHYHRLYQIIGGKSDLKSYMFDEYEIKDRFNDFINFSNK